MKKNSNSKVETTSRRQFTRAMVTAAVAAPIAASMAGCNGGSSNTNNKATTGGGTATATPTSNPKCECESIAHNSYTEITFGGFLVPEEHIPPMEIGGGGSITVDSRNKLMTLSTGSGPFTYLEDASTTAQDDRFGEIEAVMVVTETDTKPFVKVVVYSGLLPGTKLYLWYQKIAQNPSGDDTDFPSVTFPDNDPDVKFFGGQGIRGFEMTVKTKQLTSGKSHKKNRPHRFVLEDGGNVGRHFRIGQWRIVNGTQVLVGESGAENYSFFVRYGDRQ